MRIRDKEDQVAQLKQESTAVSMVNQKELIIMLYEGMIGSLKRAIYSIDEDDLETAHINLQKTNLILRELLGTLREDQGGKIAKTLNKLYTYCYERIVIANLKKDSDIVREVLGLIEQLAEGWHKIPNQGENQNQQQHLNQKVG